MGIANAARIARRHRRWPHDAGSLGGLREEPPLPSRINFIIASAVEAASPAASKRREPASFLAQADKPTCYYHILSSHAMALHDEAH